MNCDESRYHDGQMLDASFLMVSNTNAVRDFVREWQQFCTRPEILTDSPNTCGLPNLPDFVDHRHDQSVLSLLAIREGLVPGPQ